MSIGEQVLNKNHPSLKSRSISLNIENEIGVVINLECELVTRLFSNLTESLSDRKVSAWNSKIFFDRVYHCSSSAALARSSPNGPAS